MLLLLPILVPLIGGIFVFRQKNETYRDWLVVTLIVITAVMVLANCTMPTQRLWLLTIQGDLGLVLNSDWLSKFFMVLAVCIWAPVVVFTKPYIRHAGQGNQFMGFYTMTLGVLMGLAQAANFVTMYMFFEMMSLITVPLVLHNATPAARRAGFKYLGYSVFGAGMALAGYFFIAYYLTVPDFQPGGAIDFSRAAEHQPLLLVAYCLMIVGFGAKAGMMPMQSWLPAAHPVAPAPASAVLSGVITKGGVVAVIRVTYYMFGPEFLAGSWPQYVLLTLTLATVFVGSMLAYREKQLKRRLAYSTVSQVSYMMFGLSLLTPLGMVGALSHVVFHSLVKNTLFLGAGAIIYKTGLKKVSELRGIGKQMPITIWCFTLVSLTLVGIPPTSGFVSKWYLATGALAADVGAFSWIGPVVLLISALLTAGYLLPVTIHGFFPGADYDYGNVKKLEPSLWMLVPMLLMTAGAVAFGMFPAPLIHFIETIASAVM